MINIVNQQRVDASPHTLGFCPNRLERITAWMDAYVKSGRLPCAQTLVLRRGQCAYFKEVGNLDVDTRAPIGADTIFRIYSMTKPITSVGLMMLYEQGAFQLNDPVSRFIPSFRNLEVFAGGDVESYHTHPAKREITIRDLLTHTSGLTYGFMHANTVDALYRKHGLGDAHCQEPLASVAAKLSTLPLLSQPGEQWNYGVSTDVLGHVIEIISGQSLDEYLAKHILEPLDMRDTGFFVKPQALSRFASSYKKAPDHDGFLPAEDQRRSPYKERPIFLSGGGGLVSTAQDYVRFCQMLLNKGELKGVRLLGRKTVGLIMCNHLPGDMASMGQSVFSETSYDGIGFGLGFSVVDSPAKAQVLCSAGTCAWGGMASTGFWIDPEEDIIVIFMTQLIPSSTWPIRNELRVLVNQALVD